MIGAKLIVEDLGVGQVHADPEHVHAPRDEGHAGTRNPCIGPERGAQPFLRP